MLTDLVILISLTSKTMQPGKTANFFQVPKIALGFLIWYILESKVTTGIARTQEDLVAIKKILTHLEIEDRKATRIGKFNAEKGPRTLLIIIEDALSKNMILNVYISPEVTKENLEKGTSWKDEISSTMVLTQSPFESEIGHCRTKTG